MIDRIEGVLDEVRAELLDAREKHAPMHSAHEGHSVILEELDELWDEIKLKERDRAAMRHEAVQVAAMAVRFLLDVTAESSEGEVEG